MKKSTLEAICNYLNGDNSVDLSVLREEINAEYDRLTAKARANASAYEVAHDVVFACTAWDKPMTVKEIFALVENDVPDGFTASKMQYAFLHYWADEIVKHDNGKNAFTYSVK